MSSPDGTGYYVGQPVHLEAAAPDGACVLAFVTAVDVDARPTSVTALPAIGAAREAAQRVVLGQHHALLECPVRGRVL
jgi:hypothetical protein